MARFCVLLFVMFGFCARPADDPGNEVVSALILLRARQTEDAGPAGTNLSQVQFDGFTLLSSAPVTRCDADNSSGAGVVVDVSSIIAASYVKIEIVPSTTPYSFAPGGAFDLHLVSVHRPDGSAPCTLTRTANTANRYTASMSTNCGIAGHVLNRFDVDCIPD